MTYIPLQYILNSTNGYNPYDFYTLPQGMQFWAPMYDQTKLLDASGNPVTNGTAIQTVLDSAGATLFTQISNAGRRPAFDTSKGITGALNMAAGKEMISSRLSMFRNQSKVSYGLVFYPSSSSLDVISLEAFSATGGAKPIFIPWCNTVNPAIEGVRVSADSDSNAQASEAITQGTINVVLFEWDTQTGEVSIYLNNAATSVAGTAHGTTGFIEDVDNASLQFGNNGDGASWLFDAHLMVNCFMTATQREQWFAAAKAKFGVTVY